MGDQPCIDIDECQDANGGCDILTECQNQPGTRTCGPCPQGYTGNGEEGCHDIDECKFNNGACDRLTECKNVPGTRECGPCPKGYTGTGDNGCVDIDECQTNHGGCDARTDCKNEPGTWTCGHCPEGFTGTGSTGCIAPTVATAEGGAEATVPVRVTPTPEVPPASIVVPIDTSATPKTESAEDIANRIAEKAAEQTVQKWRNQAAVESESDRERKLRQLEERTRRLEEDLEARMKNAAENDANPDRASSAEDNQSETAKISEAKLVVCRARQSVWNIYKAQGKARPPFSPLDAECEQLLQAFRR
jgi:hypothetical protein